MPQRRLQGHLLWPLQHDLANWPHLPSPEYLPNSASVAGELQKLLPTNNTPHTYRTVQNRASNDLNVETERTEAVIAADHGTHGVFHPAIVEITFSFGQ